MRRRLLAASAVLATVLTACGGSGAANLSTPPPTSASPSASPTLTTNQQRCLDGADILIAASTAVLDTVTVTGGVNGSPASLQATLVIAEAQLAVLQAHPLHPPFIADRETMIQGLNDLMTGYRAILAHHGVIGPGQTSKALATKGIDEITTVQTDARVKRASCAG